MHALALASLPPDSAGALVANSSDGVAELVVVDEQGGVVAATWRRRQAWLRQPCTLRQHVLSYCLGGRIDAMLEIDGTCRTVRQSPGFCAFLPAGSTVRWHLEPADAEMVHLHLYVDPASAVDAAWLHRPQLLSGRDPWMVHCMGLLQCELRCGDDAGRPARPDLLGALATLVLQHLGRQAAEPPPATRHSRVSPLRPALLKRIDDHLDAHLRDEVTLPVLAGLVSMSVDHFVRAFHLATGSTPHQYIVSRRLEHACALLRESSLQVADVAHACGFASPAHFSALFRRCHGVSPSAFRRLS